MRKIEQEMVAAIKAGKNWHKDNTRVIPAVMPEGLSLVIQLHGNDIAKRSTTGVWSFSLAGWNTPTTRSRINAIIGSIRTSADALVIPGVCSYKGRPHLIGWVDGKARRMPIGSDMWFNPLCVTFN